MKTEAEIKKIHTAIVGEFVRQFEFAPAAIITGYIHLIVERLSFASLSRLPISNEERCTSADDLLQNDVPDECLSLVRTLIMADQLDLVEADNGKRLIEACVGYFSDQPEYIFTTAISLEREYMSSISQRLRALHGEKSRISFETSSAIVAGFIIRKGQTASDYSLAGNGHEHLRSFIRNRFIESIKGAS